MESEQKELGNGQLVSPFYMPTTKVGRHVMLPLLNFPGIYSQLHFVDLKTKTQIEVVICSSYKGRKCKSQYTNQFYLTEKKNPSLDLDKCSDPQSVVSGLLA